MVLRRILKTYDLPLISIVGIVIGFFICTTNLQIEIGEYFIGLFHFSYILHIIILSELIINNKLFRSYNLLYLNNGILIYLIINYFNNHGQIYFNICALSELKYSIPIIIYYFVVSKFMEFNKNSIKETRKPQLIKPLIYFFIIGFLTIVFFRISQFILLEKGVPNEERSLIIFNVEVHHLISGYFGLLLLLPFIVYSSRKRFRKVKSNHLNNIIKLISFVLLSFMIDQSTYFLFLDLDDLSYFSPTSLYGSILLLLIIIIYIYLKKTYDSNKLRK